MDQNMMMAARAFRADFFPAEQATDLAAARTARLLATVLEQRAATGVSIGIGASMIRKLTKSLNAQVEAREEFLMAHQLAAKLPADLGLDVRMYGDVVECPPDDKTNNGSDGGTVVMLKSVA